MATCPFCKIPCGNEHCPYFKEQTSEELKSKVKGLEEENKRLKQTIKDFEKFAKKEES